MKKKKRQKSAICAIVKPILCINFFAKNIVKLCSILQYEQNELGSEGDLSRNLQLLMVVGTKAQLCCIPKRHQCCIRRRTLLPPYYCKHHTRKMFLLSILLDPQPNNILSLSNRNQYYCARTVERPQDRWGNFNVITRSLVFANKL